MYLITDEGEVISLKYGKRKTLSHRFNPQGYRVATIKFGDSFKTVSVHRLVAEIFLDNPNNKPQINHIDGNKSNPFVSNLEWCTQKENARHSVDLLRNNRGEKNGSSRLTEDQVRFIKYESNGIGAKRLSKIFPCSHVNITKIRQGKHWKWV